MHVKLCQDYTVLHGQKHTKVFDMLATECCPSVEYLGSNSFLYGLEAFEGCISISTGKILVARFATFAMNFAMARSFTGNVVSLPTQSLLMNAFSFGTELSWRAALMLVACTKEVLASRIMDFVEVEK